MNFNNLVEEILQEFILEGAFDYPKVEHGESIVEYVKKLTNEFINPDSIYNSNKRNHYGKTKEEWDRGYQKSSNAFPYPKTIWDVNCGHCEEFAEALQMAFPNGEIVDLGELYINDKRFLPKDFNNWKEEDRLNWIDEQDLPSHYAYLYNGRYYDAQHPNGVTDWTALDVMRYGGGQVTRQEYLKGKNLSNN